MDAQGVSRPRQAVILAGGRGTRLRPLTDTRPKPMLEFHGTPFMAYLLELLRDQGFERVLLLLGYLPEVIQAYCGDGSRWDLKIEYAISGVEDETGLRLKRAASRLDPLFLLMYCDNYWPMPFDRMWQRYVAMEAQAMLTVYENRDRYTRDNVRVDDEGYVVAYDKDRLTPGLHGVEVGFGIFRREILARLPEGGNVSFERSVYPQLVEERQLVAFLTSHRYYSVSSPERMPLTAQFLAHRPTVIVDRDGVLNKKPPRAHYVCSWDEWEWLPGAREALQLFKQAGYRLVVVSNQAGIARGVMTEEALASLHERMKAEAEEAGGGIDAVYYCPHGWDSPCECRKPKPGMLYAAQRDFHLDLSRTPFIGDDERDGQTADAAGCPWIRVSEDRPLLEATRELLGAQGSVRSGVLEPSR